MRETGHDVLAVAEAMPRAADPVILARAVEEQRVLITSDKDCGELVFRLGQAHSGILLLRLRDEHPANRVRVVGAVIQQWGDRLAGVFTVATETEVWLLPRTR